jgi:hypothetical protein
MQAWPIETQRKLRSQCLEKYKWIYTRQQRLMQQLNEKNENILESAKKITDNTDKYYPIANDRTKEKFVEFTMNQVNNNDKRFLATNNRRYNFF